MTPMGAMHRSKFELVWLASGPSVCTFAMHHSIDNAAASAAAVEIFYSYSHKDEKLRDRLEKHLSILKREGVIAGWHDRKIAGGKEWAKQIDDHLNSAQIILLLVSADFVASDYCYGVEVTRAMERHEKEGARVIPVILRPCDWSTAPFGRLEGFPKDAKPITKWSNREEAFTNVALGIREVVAELQASNIKPVSTPVISTEAQRLPPIWNVPHLRDRNFTGREELLEQLHKSLASGKAAALTKAMVGLGGVGKTRTAVEYCYRYAGEYRLVWWMASEEPGKLAADYAALAQKLNLPERDDQDQVVVVRAVRHSLSRSSGWLLVFDNARTADGIKAYLPAGHGHVIVTSRNPAFRKIAEVLPVKVMTLAEAVEFLMKRAEGDANEAEALATELGRLPLALAQAGAYIDKHGSTFGRYLEMFRAHQKDVLARGAEPDDVTVATTWELAFAEAERKSEASAQLMNLCAFLAPDDIWQRLLKDGAEFLPEPLAEAVGDALSWDEALGALRAYSLLEVKGEVVSVHRLVQAVVRARLDEAGRMTCAEAAVRLVNEAFPFDSDDFRTWPVCARLLPHAQSAERHAEEFGVARDATGRLLNQEGLYLRGRAEFAEARACLERAIRINETVYGRDHTYVATSVSNLGNVLGDLGNLEGARACHEQALRIDEAAHGPEHPTVAIHVNNLGLVLQDLGDLEGARACFEKALKIDQAAYGPKDSNVAIRISNLGGVLQDLGDLQGARACYEQALKIDEATYGLDYPDVANDVNNLGLVLQDLGDLQGARAYYERALKIGETAYGPEHPSVATYMNNLGRTLKGLGDLKGARACFERALRLREKSLGKDHPKTLIVRGNLEAFG